MYFHHLSKFKDDKESRSIGYSPAFLKIAHLNETSKHTEMRKGKVEQNPMTGVVRDKTKVGNE
jgi:hypothetical protein